MYLLFLNNFFSDLPIIDAVLKCYHCTMTLPNLYTNETPRLCQNFDESEKFIVDCPYSTFCMKKNFTVNLSEPINATLRGCANQKEEIQVLKNNEWQSEIRIEEPYKEGCFSVNDKGLRMSMPTYCYCKGNLCNGAMKITNIYIFYFIFVFTLCSFVIR